MKSANADLAEGGKEWAGLVYIGGTHPASAGGAWKAAVQGFAGIKIKDGKITCNPTLPENWKSMKFKINLRGNVYSVNITKNNRSVEKL